ncbi:MULTISPECIES: hypothetical protein [unclassified Nocardioides]|uniref:hypothetical protein n=1 Tax=unclassified Nocardioides TaxID=2615069 RepID=UPI0030149803
MRRLAAALILSLLASLAVVVPTAAPAQAAAVVSSDPARLGAYPGLVREDFEGSKVGDGQAFDCGPTVVSSATANSCYDVGDIAPGVTLDTPSSTTYGVGAGTAGFEGLTSTVVMSFQFVDSLSLAFSGRVEFVGFRLGSIVSSGTCGLKVTYADGSPATTRNLACPALPSMGWVVIEADRPIASVILSGDGAEVIDDLAFGSRAVPRIDVRKPSVNRKAGTARLPVAVPGIGTTTVTGPGIRTASVDSARARVLVLPIAARGPAARKLKRKGKVTVRVTVTYRPNAGSPVTALKSVTLRKKRR